MSVALLVSGLLVCAAVLWPTDRVAWRLEMTALPLGAASWISYATVTESLIWRIIAASFILFVALRVLSAWLVARHPVRVLLVLR
ncbi:hypothetical protein [Ornithinimicrobium avium]|uniref:Uncharacterized protein n=1 Tax=Ornithinimicrobium avium TaxID=2283195 RepID=A0A345NQ51_9MICO|nr:hypothetical protein [Ornithinimicrobium avium]AXH97159.1 hypothetical protein DV701_14460 [Ornithinimicrobium avium]